ncbi:hypothetical protein DPMN_124525 [Dreissena polymorpha]|uniref:Uncharacterized protein n=1 Tax=Dreissena polymorpha TaxID=45954 RepID=A0A9D4GW76_DREPO|nr:hypothetical protein DPMN_124525 [Dreissena polymorpha]
MHTHTLTPTRTQTRAKARTQERIARFAREDGGDDGEASATEKEPGPRFHSTPPFFTKEKVIHGWKQKAGIECPSESRCCLPHGRGPPFSFTFDDPELSFHIFEFFRVLICCHHVRVLSLLLVDILLQESEFFREATQVI